MILKYVGLILILISSTTLGFAYGDKYKKRVLELKEIQRSLFQLKNEIIYTYTPLPEAFFNLSLKSNGVISEIFNEISNLLASNEMNSVFDAFKSSINSNKNKLNLKEEDLRILLDLSKSLGETDIEGHKGVFNLALESLKKQCDTAEDLMNKNLKMYRSLGFTLGSMIVLILI